MITHVVRRGDFLWLFVHEDEREFDVLINIRNILNIEIDEKIVTILSIGEVEHQYYYIDGIDTRLISALNSKY